MALVFNLLMWFEKSCGFFLECRKLKKGKKILTNPPVSKLLYNKYAKYTPEDRYIIGKYASENGPIAAVRKFNSKFANLNESTARTFRDKYEEQITVAKKKGTVTEKSIISEKRGRPLLLGGIDEMVQKYQLVTEEL